MEQSGAGGHSGGAGLIARARAFDHARSNRTHPHRVQTGFDIRRLPSLAELLSRRVDDRVRQRRRWRIPGVGAHARRGRPDAHHSRRGARAAAPLVAQERPDRLRERWRHLVRAAARRHAEGAGSSRTAGSPTSHTTESVSSSSEAATSGWLGSMAATKSASKESLAASTRSSRAGSQPFPATIETSCSSNHRADLPEICGSFRRWEDRHGV